MVFRETYLALQSATHSAVRRRLSVIRRKLFEAQLSSGHTEDARSSNQQPLGLELVVDFGSSNKRIASRHGIAGQVCLFVSDRDNEIRVQLRSRVAERHGGPHSMTRYGQYELVAQANAWPSDSASSGPVTLEVIEVLRAVVITLLGWDSQKKGLVES